jgi:integrase/recombinase XerD
MRTTEIHLRADPTEKLNAAPAVTPLAQRRGRFRLPDRLIAELLGEE